MLELRLSAVGAAIVIILLFLIVLLRVEVFDDADKGLKLLALEVLLRGNFPVAKVQQILRYSVATFRVSSV